MSEILVESARVSVANLATRVVNPLTGAAQYFGLLDQKRNRISALGGAVHLTQEGKAYLQKHFRAASFEEDATAGLKEPVFDARFVVPDRDYVEGVFKLFAREGKYFKINLRDEIHHELLELGVLSEDQIDALYLQPMRSSVRQARPQDGVGTSARALQGIETCRLFHLFSVHFQSPDVYQAFVSHPHIRLLAAYEVETTKYGACKGNTVDGIEIADNLFKIPAVS